MSWLSFPFSLLPFLYFCPADPGDKVLIVTDHPERVEQNFSLFNLAATFWLPRRLGGKVRSYTEGGNRILFGDPIDPPDADYKIVVIDLEERREKEGFSAAARYLSPKGSLIFLDWSLSRWQTLRQVPRALSSGGKLGKEGSELRDNGLRLDWDFRIAPGLEKPSYLVKTGFETDIPARSSSRIKNWALCKGGFYLQPHHRALVATKRGWDQEAANSDPVRRVVKELIGTRAADRQINKSITSIRVSTTNVLLIGVSHKKASYYIRFPFTEGAIKRMNTQRELVTFLHGQGLTCVPRPVPLEAELPLPCYVEEGVRGSCGDKVNLRGSEGRTLACCQQALSAIRAIHQRFGRLFRMGDRAFDRYVQWKLDIVKKVLNTEKGDRALHRIGDQLWKAFKDKWFLSGISHGDFKIDNCLFDNNWRISGMIDWDMGSRDDLSFVDLSSLFAKTMRELRNLSMAQLVLEDHEIPQAFLALYSDYFKVTGTSFVDPKAAILFYWVDRVFKKLTTFPMIRETWCMHNIAPVLDEPDGMGKIHVAAS